MKNLNKKLFTEITQLILAAKQQAARAVNSELTMLYWQIGKRISEEILNNDRAEYGKQVIENLAENLTNIFGKGWNRKQLHHFLRFFSVFPDREIVSAVRRQLSWTHIKSIIYIDNTIKQKFYMQMAIIENWSTRTLAERIDSQLFERTAISRKPEITIAKELELLSTNEIFSKDLLLKDPYILDFLDLKDSYLEKDLEDAILRDLQQFLLELGTGFTFIARQHRIQIDNDDFYIDLLFYNRKLKRLIAIDLKISSFKPSYKGQMELYLRWLTKHEHHPGENPPLGIILCTGKKQEQIELLELDQSGIHVAEYLTTLPPKKILEQRLRSAMQNAANKYGRTDDKKDR